MSKKIKLIFYTMIVVLISTKSIQTVQAAGGTIGNQDCDYEINSVDLDGEYIDIKGWLYTSHENAFVTKAKGNSIQEIKNDISNGKTHGYSIKVGNYHYFDIGDYYVDHTDLRAVQGQTPQPYKDVGFHFRIPVIDLLNSGYSRFTLEMHFYQSNNRDYYKNVSYIAPNSTHVNERYTLTFNSSGETSTFYTTGNMTYVRSNPSKNAAPLKSEYGYGPMYGYQLHFTRYNYFSLANKSYTGVRILDENKCSWYQVRVKETGQSSDGRARVIGDANGRYGWLSGVFSEYATENFSFTIARNQSIYSFDANGGKDAPESMIKYPLENFIFPSKIPTYTGYQFLGWSEVRNGSVQYLPNQEVSNLPDYDKTFYAVWENSMPEIITPIIPENSSDLPPFIEGEYLIIQLGDTFEAKKFAKAEDKEDGDLTSQIEVVKNEVIVDSTFKTLEPGIFDVEYSIQDSGGNRANKTIQVLVNDPPVIEASNRYFFIGESINDQLLLKDVNASDLEDGNITNKIKIIENKVDTKKIGVYPVIYEVTDRYQKTVVKKVLIHITNDQFNQERLGLRYINSNYLDTLSIKSKWVINPYLNNLLKTTLNKESTQSNSLYIFKWSQGDNEKMKDTIINNGDFSSLYLKYQVK